MAVLNKDKAAYAIQTFLMFLNVTQETHKSLAAEIAKYQEAAVDLLAKLMAGQVGPLAASLQLNAQIEELNQLIKTPYPSLLADSPENFVKGEIVAFEHYLNQELKANNLTINQEVPLFNDSLRLWEKVGVSLTAKEGVSEFAALVEKLNTFLPESDQYPLPDINQY